MRLFSLLVVLTVFTACTDVTFPPVEELAPNPLEAGGPQLFSITEINFIERGNFARDVEVKFAHIYDELPQVFQENINGVYIVTPRTSVDGPLSRDNVFEQNYMVGDSLCYAFGFTGPAAVGEGSRSTRVCFRVE